MLELTMKSGFGTAVAVADAMGPRLHDARQPWRSRTRTSVAAALCAGLALMIAGTSVDAELRNTSFGLLGKHQGKWRLLRESATISRAEVSSTPNTRAGIILRGVGQDSFTLQTVVSPPIIRSAVPAGLMRQAERIETPPGSWVITWPIVVEPDHPLGRWSLEVYMDDRRWETIYFDLIE